MTRKVLWESIASSIKLQQSMGKSVWVVAHFLDSFSQCQTMLEQNSIDYVVETDQVFADRLADYENAVKNQVRLLLAELAEPVIADPGTATSNVKVAMMVVERHPFGPRDEKLAAFADSLPAKVELGYFLALDDELVKRMVPPQMIDLMRAMGLQDHDLISSSMVTRRLQKLIERTSREVSDGPTAASALEWFLQVDEGRSN